MKILRFQLLNVFTTSGEGSHFSGNALALIEDGNMLKPQEMQALAQQFNLSETVFLLAPKQADARLAIYTPWQALPFAGHPSIGATHVLTEQLQREKLVMECEAGLIQAERSGDAIWISPPQSDLEQAPDLPRQREAGDPASALAAVMGVADAWQDEPAFIDTGAEHLLLAVPDPATVQQAKPDITRLADWPANQRGRRAALLFAFLPDQADGKKRVMARFFSVTPQGALVEDPGTGSAIANLGGWWRLRHPGVALDCEVDQGEQTGRPCRLLLQVSEQGQIHIGGRVQKIGSGELQLP